MAGHGSHGNVEDFIQRMGLDDRASEAVWTLSPESQFILATVMEKVNCKNPSAVAWSKIRAIQRNPLEMKAECIRQMVDEPCGQALDSLPPAVQHDILGQIDLMRVRNPSAFIWSKIKAGGKGAGGARDRSRTPRPMHGGMGMDLAEALATPAGRMVAQALGAFGHGGMAPPAPMAPHPAHPQLDAKAQRALRELTPEQQHIVMYLVGYAPCKNPSAVAWSKVKQVKENPHELKMDYFKKAVDEKAMKALSELPEETQDAIVSDLDVTKVRNLSAVVWSKVKAALGMQTGGRIDAPRRASQTGAAESSDLAEMAGVQLDSKCLDALRQLPVEEQRRIISEVDLTTVKNPSAFVWSKVKKNRQASF